MVFGKRGNSEGHRSRRESGSLINWCFVQYFDPQGIVSQMLSVLNGKGDHGYRGPWTTDSFTDVATPKFVHTYQHLTPKFLGGQHHGICAMVSRDFNCLNVFWVPFQLFHKQSTAPYTGKGEDVLCRGLVAVIRTDGWDSSPSSQKICQHRSMCGKSTYLQDPLWTQSIRHEKRISMNQPYSWQVYSRYVCKGLVPKLVSMLWVTRWDFIILFP